MGDPAACYVISGEHGARKKVLDNALPDAAGVFFYTPRYLFEHSVRVPSLWADCVWFRNCSGISAQGSSFSAGTTVALHSAVFKCAGPWRGSSVINRRKNI